MERDKDRLNEAVARLRQEGLAEPLPNEVVDETLRRIAARGLQIADSHTARLPTRNPKSAIRSLVRLTAAAAVFVLLGYTAGRLSAPRPMDLDRLREALVPSVAAAIEPAIRERAIEDLRPSYQLALSGMYVRVKQELTEQYRDDMNRFAAQMLAASNAVTNQLLAELVHTIKAEQNEDLRRVAAAIRQIELKRLQDKNQLAAGLETLAYRTEDELERTRNGLVQLLVNTYPLAEVPLRPETASDPNERS